MQTRTKALVAAIAVLTPFAGLSFGQEVSVSTAVRHDTSRPLRELVAEAGPVQYGPSRQMRDKAPVSPAEAVGPELERDPLLDSSALAVSLVPTPDPSLSFEGTTDDDNAAVVGFRLVPPDTNGDVGLEHYVQFNNVIFEIFDKFTGSSILGPAAGNSLWTGFGGVCEARNDGDPVVLYDHLADRWVFSQFANPLPDNGHQCFAVSTTPDPTGPYHRYDFVVSPFQFNDYPKIGVWPDAYYMSIREFPGIFPGRMTAVAVERDVMLVGGAAQMVGPFSPGSLGAFDGMLPSHLEGRAPPPGTPNTYVRADDGPDRYELWDFAVDWVTPANSTFTSTGSVPTVSFSSAVPDVPSLGDSMDSLAHFTMYRLQYRDFGTHRSMVLNHTVNAGGGRAGIRWAELRNTGAGWFNFQTGTHAPGSDHRWMGSIAQDRNGNIALGYSTSCSTTHPSIRYTSRMAGDPLGTMPGGEITLHAGTGSQIGSFTRWGDYSSMSTDPFPDCSFWYTNEYYDTISSFDFKTRVGNFKFPDCGPSLVLKINGDAGDVVTVPAAPSPFDLTIAGDDGDSSTPMDWYFAVIFEGVVYWIGSCLAEPL